MTNAGAAEEHDVPPPSRARVQRRRRGYFGGRGSGYPLTGLAIWALGGLIVLLAATAVLHRPRRR